MAPERKRQVTHRNNYFHVYSVLALISVYPVNTKKRASLQ